MEFDTTTVIISIIGCLVGILLIFFKPSKYLNSSGFLGSIKLLLGGFLLIVGMAIVNCILEQQCDIVSIKDFLSLRIAGKWIFRVLASFGYIFIIWGLVSLLILKIKFKKTVHK